MALGVQADDAQLDLLPLLDDVTGMGDPLVGQLADVDQALEALLDAHERAEVDELGDGAVDDVADLYLVTDSCHGSGCRRRIERLIRPRS